MSNNIGKQPIKIAEGVNVTLSNGRITVVGPKGSLETHIPQGIDVVVEDNQVVVRKKAEDMGFDKFAGLARAQIANMVEGVVMGFEKKLELTGVGYRARVDGANLVLNVGYAVPVTIKPVDGTAITVDENIITVSGSNKQLVGDVASDIRAVRPPDPYKGKGIKYVGERIRRKVGKAAKAVGAAK